MKHPAKLRNNLQFHKTDTDSVAALQNYSRVEYDSVTQCE